MMRIHTAMFIILETNDNELLSHLNWTLTLNVCFDAKRQSSF